MTTDAGERGSRGTLPSRLHIVGVGGTGMGALAGLLVDGGHEVSGSDVVPLERMWSGPSIEALRRRGLRVSFRHDPENVSPDTGTVIRSRSIPDENVEVQRARELGIPVVWREDALGMLMQGRHGVSIAGSTGKSTTTAMAAVILDAAGLDPTVNMGGGLPIWEDRNYRSGGSPIFLTETDESNLSFLEQPYQTALVTSVYNVDHVATFPSDAELDAAFARFAEPLSTLVVNADDAGCRRLAATRRTPPTVYGLGDGAGWRGVIRERTPQQTRYQVFRDGVSVGEGVLRVPGRHSVENACGAIALCEALGVAPSLALEALGEFVNVRGRLERRADLHGAAVYEDIGHHRYQVQASLDGIRQLQPGRRIVALFLARHAGWTFERVPNLARAFTSVEMLYVTGSVIAHQYDRSLVQPVSGADVAATFERNGCHATDIGPLESGVPRLVEQLGPGDVLVIFGRAARFPLRTVLARLASEPC